MDPILPEVEQNKVSQSDEMLTTPVASGYANAEVAPNMAPEQPREAAISSGAVQTPIQQPVQQPVGSDTPAVDDSSVSNSSTASDNPVIADDVDVIEKEWVEKAKKIVGDTKSDPYQQEKQVSHLQADYLMKRYNKQVKLPE